MVGGAQGSEVVRRSKGSMERLSTRVTFCHLDLESGVSQSRATDLKNRTPRTIIKNRRDMIK